MNYNEVLEIVKKLEFDSKRLICKDGNTELYLLRPSKLSKRFKNYDIKKNFQIWMIEEDNKPFRPNHLRAMIDLNLRTRSRPDLKRKLLEAFDDVFYKKDPNDAIIGLNREKFQHYINSLKIIANLSQLFLIEQEYAYHRESNYIPPTLFYQGWIRAFIDAKTPIDVMSLSIGQFRPPPDIYTKKENANPKNKHYDPDFKKLWYFE